MGEGSHDDDERVGCLLQERYRIVRRMGEGGMGAVYEARHELIGRKLAIKTLHPQLARDADLVERFHREARAATAIGNEHIIEVTDFGVFPDDRAPYIVMEFLAGIEFGELLDREGSLPVARVVHIVGQVCEALAAAHAQGIVHRDIKPENIFLVPRAGDPDFVKVLDFGISKIRAGEEDLKSGLTKTGMAIGTPYYMPPEQAQAAADLDHRADIYAVGVILYQALCGRLPFNADTYPALLMKIMSEEAIAPSRLREDIPPELEQVVMRAMAKDRRRRFARVEELGLALVPFAALDRAPVMLRSLRPSGGERTGPIEDESAIAMIETALSSTPPQGEGAADVTVPPAAATPRAQDATDTRPSPNTQTPMARGDAAITSQAPDAGVARLAVFAGVALALIGAGALAFVAFSPRGAGPPAAEPHPAMPAPAEPAPTVAPRPSPPPAAPSKAEVRVRIRATPAQARIFIGEVEFPNPTDASRPRSMDPVRIRVEADGHRAIEQLAIFDQDREIAFELDKGSGTRRIERVAGRPAAAAKPAAPKPAAAAPSEAAAPAEPPPTPPQPPEDPRTHGGDGVYRGPTGEIRDEF